MRQQNNILISACLLGSPVRYNGTDLLIDHPLIKKWTTEKRLVSICPEVAGGMSVPRAPAEIVNGNGLTVLKRISKVVDSRDADVTKAFILGAEQSLKMAIEMQCRYAILTERSPSCGSSKIYDGTFSGSIKDGMGVTAALLEQHGISVFNQHQLEQLEALI